MMCLATCECLALINVLSSQQHSEERKGYNPHRADREMELRRCTAKSGTEQGDKAPFLS